MAKKPSRSPGRPREFEEGHVLDAAIATFASRGFTAASLSELTTATGLSGGSLYKAFGDKNGVFAHALDRYVALHETAITDALASGNDARGRIAAVLHFTLPGARGRPVERVAWQ